MIHVIAIITAKPGKRSELLEAFNKVVPLVLREKGCIEYNPVTDIESGGPSQSLLGPDSYAVIEKWEALEDLQAHALSEHMVEYGKSVNDLVADRKIHILS